MPNKTHDYGDLRITLTSEFDWRWDDTGTGARRDGAFWHPKPQDDLRPVGSVVFEGHPNPNNNWAALLIGDSRPPHARHSPAVRSPERYDWVWSDKGSGGKHDVSVWRPVAPAGYVALGDVAVRGGSAPGIDEIYCVREDLVRPATYEDNPTWDDKGSGGKWDASFWRIYPRAPSASDDKEWIPVVAGSFRFSAGYGQPSYTLARVPLLHLPPRLKEFSNEPPALAPDRIPENGETFNKMEQSSITLPFTSFFDPNDRISLDNIHNPFCTVTKNVAWVVHEKATNNTASPATTNITITKGGRQSFSREMEHQAGIEIEKEAGVFGLGKFKVTLNYQFRYSETSASEIYKEQTIHQSVTIPPHHVCVIWVRRAELYARRSDGSQITTQLNFSTNEEFAISEVPIRA